MESCRRDSHEFRKLRSDLESHHDLSPELKDFVVQLVQPIPEDRLGFLGGASQVMAHPWFKDFDWEALRGLKMVAPYKPDITRKNVDRRISVMDLEEQLVGFKADVPKVDKSKQFHFEKYHWNNELTPEDQAYLTKRSGCGGCTMS